jgi:hypothetical protein
METSDQLAASLSRSRAALDAGSEAIGGLIARIGTVAQQTAGQGCPAIAQRLQACQQLAAEARQGVTGLRDVLGEMETGVRAVPQEASPQLVISVLAPVAQRGGELPQSIHGIAEQLLGRVKQQIAVALQGGQPGLLLAAVEQAQQALARAAQEIRTTGEQVGATIIRAQQAGNAGN